MRLALQASLWVLAAGLLLSRSASADFVIYQDNFSGSSATLLNGVPEDNQGTVWSANNFVNADGSINGANEGSALLPFDPVPNFKYTLSMDVFMPAGVDRWIGLGFARDALISPGANNTNDRLSNEPEGLSWFLYRDSAVQADEIQIFRGARTANQITDTNPTITFGQFNNLKIEIDTTGDGSTFTANYFLNNTSLLAGGTPVTISAFSNPGGVGSVTPVVSAINYVGFAFDNTTTNTALRVDNFSLTAVPEASSFLSMGAVTFIGLGIARLRRRP